LEEAVRQGFRAMQFNFVVETNLRALAIWDSYGFERVGRLPRAFRHPRAGYVDAFVLYKRLV
ncbi:MAG: GNAT family N-acetyltransferase, partial [Pseudomonadota bacterium]